MEKGLRLTIIAALENKSHSTVDANNVPVNFSAEQVNDVAIKGILKAAGMSENPTAYELQHLSPRAFALIEESIDEILPAKIAGVLDGFAEIRSFPRDAEPVFNIEKIGKNRAKLTIGKGARGGIYRAARTGDRYFTVPVHVETVAVAVNLEDVLLGYVTLGELYSNILEGFEEIVYKEIFNALATATPIAGYERIGGDSVTTTKDSLGGSIDKVMPYVKQYGIPTIFGSYQALSALSNEGSTSHPELVDSAERRQYGAIQLDKGCLVVVLPNYLVDNTNKEWFYDPAYVFVLPSGAQPAKVAFKGNLYLKQNPDALGGEKWEAHKMIGVGIAMANNFAVIKVTDLGD